MSKTNNNSIENEDRFYSSKILYDGIESIFNELNEVIKDNINKQYFNSINEFILDTKDLKNKLNNKLLVEKMIFNELNESIDYTIIVKDDKKDKKELLTNLINKYIDFQYEIMKDCFFILKEFSYININMYKKYVSDFKYKIMSLSNAINLANINIMANIEYIEDINKKRAFEENVIALIDRFNEIYSKYKQVIGI